MLSRGSSRSAADHDRVSPQAGHGRPVNRRNAQTPVSAASTDGGTRRAATTAATANQRAFTCGRSVTQRQAARVGQAVEDDQDQVDDVPDPTQPKRDELE